MVDLEPMVCNEAATITSLQSEFPGWRVWTSDAGTWWASRRGPQWNEEPRTVAADTAEGLRGELREALAAVPGPSHG